MFGRKKDKQAGEPEEVDAVAEEAVAEEPEQPAVIEFDRGSGPFDIEETPDTSGHADFGCLLVPGLDGMTVQLEADPSSGQLVAMTIVRGPGALQVRALAAPRSGGQWPTSLEALRAQVNGSGGRADAVEGPFGAELHAMVPVPAGQPGGPGLRPMRFAGVEGPRWLLTGAFMGAGTDPAAWDDINEVFRNLIVVRGEEAMPVGALLTFRIPEQAAPAPAEEQQPTLESLEPTDPIAEVR